MKPGSPGSMSRELFSIFCSMARLSTRARSKGDLYSGLNARYREGWTGGKKGRKPSKLTDGQLKRSDLSRFFCCHSGCEFIRFSAWSAIQQRVRSWSLTEIGPTGGYRMRVTW